MHSGESKTFGAAVNTHTRSCVGGGYDGKIAGLYDLEETLGSGHFAVVKQARHVFTGAKVAVKVVDKTKLDEVSKAHLFQEVRCMKLVQHPNVVRLYEVIDTQTKLYLVLELGDGGDLYDYIMKHEGGLSEDLARRYFRQILRAITYCHQLHVVHRDLKPENVVFFEKLGVVKLTDFGFSNKFAPGQKLDTFCGSLAYSAPEILLGDSYDAPAVDIWSLGVILYMLVCGTAPFEKANDSETLTMIMDCKYTVPAQITQTCQKLIASMLVRDPKKRATLIEIAADPWLHDCGEGDANDFMPLVSREEISEEDHAFIIQKMINGNIATKEEILQSLDSNKYNHITATYFLLAEIKLRKRRDENAQKCESSSTSSKMQGRPILKINNVEASGESADSITKNTVVNKNAMPVNICPPTFSNETKVAKRNRKCSIVREEEEDESSYEHRVDGNELKVATTRRESISDGRLNRSVQECVNPTIQPQPPPPPLTLPVSLPSIKVRNHHEVFSTVNSMLVEKLNQIEKSSPAENTNEAKAKLLQPQQEEDTLLQQNFKELDTGKYKTLLGGAVKNPVLTHRRTKLNKIRTPSCSSSEASDDDSNVRNKKKINKFVGDTPSRFRMHRRDSHDDSSDSQDPAFPPTDSSQNNNNTSNVIATNNSNQKKEDTGKSSQPSSHTQRSKKQAKDNFDKLTLNQSAEKQSSTKMNIRNHHNHQQQHHHTHYHHHHHHHHHHNHHQRQRKSQSLDRITEAQEYELRYKCLAMNTPHIEQSNSLFDLKVFSVAETREEEHDDDDNESDTISISSNHFRDVLAISSSPSTDIKTNTLTNNLKSKRNTTTTTATATATKNIYNLETLGKLDLVMEEKGLTKSLQDTGMKCIVTMKKIRRLGKYFPVVNCS